jgi:phage terminase small subunit
MLRALRQRSEAGPMPRDENGLTPRQAAFVREYVKDNNGKQAAIRAGYSEKGAEVQASELLRIPKVRRALGLKLKKAELTAEWVLKRLRMEAKGRPDSTAGARVQALNSIAKIQGYVTEKHEHSGPDGEPITVKVVKYVLDPEGED